MTVSLELGGADASRSFIEAAAPEHPSLLDPTHRLGAMFGVVNIPNVIWIDEQGIIVRPPEPGWPGPTEYPASFIQRMAERAKEEAQAAAASADDPVQPKKPNIASQLRGGQDRDSYPDALRDWARLGTASRFVLDEDEVIAASQPHPVERSGAAAHFELATYLWNAGHRDAAIHHFNECHRLQPENWTYKRQAWSLIGREQVPGEMGMFTQVPMPGAEADWPFIGSFDKDVAELDPGQYYPKTF